MDTTLNSMATNKPDPSAEEVAARELVRLAKEQGLSLTGPDGLLKQLTKSVLETALNEEMTEHLGRKKNRAPADRGSTNVRNGTRPKSVLIRSSGTVDLEVPRDRDGTFEPVIVAGRLEAIEESEVVAQVSLNLTAPILLTRAALPSLRESDHGLVINMSSGIGLVAMPFDTTYAATKAGVAHFGEALRRELSGEGVHVLTLYPGATSTPMMESSNAGAAEGFGYESPELVADATVEAILGGRLTVVRGGQKRRNMIASNREDPSSVDGMPAERKPLLEKAVEAHSGI